MFSRDEDGTIYSRRMRKDVEKAERDKANGKGGGNPGLKPGVNPPDNQKLNGGDKAQKPEARSQKPEAAPQPRAPAGDDPETPSARFDRVLVACRDALGAQTPTDPVIGPIILLLDRGIRLDDVLTVLRSEAQRPRQRPVRTWKLWAEKIVEALNAAPKVAAPKPAAAENPDDPLVKLTEEVAWPESLCGKIVRQFELYPDSWPQGIGPEPGQPGCLMPERLLPERFRGAAEAQVQSAA